MRGNLRAITEERVAADYLKLIYASQNSLRCFFTMLANTANLPMVFFCAKGRDRTGIVAAMLLTLMRCHRDDILDNYENAVGVDVFIPSLESEAFARAGLCPSAYKLAYMASRRSMAIFLESVACEHVSIDHFMYSFLGLSPLTVEAIKSNLRD